MPVTFTAEISFTTGAFDTPVWVDITPYTRLASTSRGRQYELDRFEAGTLTMTLHDYGTGCFDPLNTGGPFYGDLTVGKQVRLVAHGTWGASTVFYGYTTGWQSAGQQNWADVTLSCADLMHQMGRGLFGVSQYTQLVTANLYPTGTILAWYRCDESVGLDAIDQSGNGLDGFYSGSIGHNVRGALSFDYDKAVSTNVSPVGALVPNAAAYAFDVSVAGWFQTGNANGTVFDRRPTGAADPTVMVAVAAGALTIQIGAATTSVGGTPSDGLWHFIGLTNNGANCELWYDNTLVYTGAAISIDPSDELVIGDLVDAGSNLQGQLDEWMLYTASPAAHLADYYTYGIPGTNPIHTGDLIGVVLQYAVGWTGFTALDTGYIEVRGLKYGQALNPQPLQEIQNIELTEGPKLVPLGDPLDQSNTAVFYITRNGVPTFLVGDRATTVGVVFGPDVPGGEVPWRPGSSEEIDDQYLFTIVTASTADGVEVSSVETFLGYGLSSTYALPQTMYLTALEAKQRTQWLLAWLQTPRVRLATLVVESYAQDDTAAQVLAELEVASFASVKDPTGRWTIDTVEVARVGHTIDMSTGAWVTQVQVTPAYTL